MSDSLKDPAFQFATEEERLIAALSVAVLGLDLIAHSRSPERSQRDAAVVLAYLRRKYGVVP